MAATTALLSIDEYFKTQYRPDCDFVDGELEERNVGERDHNRIQLLIGSSLLSHEREWNIEVIPGERTRVSKSRVRVPDTSLVCRNIPVERVTVTPHFLCIEVVSPEDRLARITKRLDDFARMGVPQSMDHRSASADRLRLHIAG